MDLNEKEGTDYPDQRHQTKDDSAADSDMSGDEIGSEASYGDDDDDEDYYIDDDDDEDYYIDDDNDDDDDENDDGYDTSVTDGYEKRLEHSESSYGIGGHQYAYDKHARTTSFWQRYHCRSTSSHEQVESSDKVILPASALDVLTSLQIDYPMLFEFQPYYFDADETQTVRASHCGVWEFTAEEGFVCMPNWMMENMHLREGDLVLLQNKALPKGTHVKLQPHTMDFLDIPDPRAMLEAALGTFSCLTTGDTIVLPYGNKKYYMDIIETKPSDAIGITDTDCEVDFAPPLDYKEPEKPVAASIPLHKEAAAVHVEEPKFSAFKGTGNRLDGKPLQYEPALDSSSFVAANGNAHTCTGSNSQGTSRRAQGKLIFSTDATPSSAPKVASKEVKQQQQLQQKEKPKFLAFGGKTYSLT